MIIRKEFACVAEAVGYYLEQGYHAVDSTERSRIMRRDRDDVIDVVVINHESLLSVSADECVA